MVQILAMETKVSYQRLDINIYFRSLYKTCLQFGLLINDKNNILFMSSNGTQKPT